MGRACTVGQIPFRENMFRGMLPEKNSTERTWDTVVNAVGSRYQNTGMYIVQYFSSETFYTRLNQR